MLSKSSVALPAAVLVVTAGGVGAYAAAAAHDPAGQATRTVLAQAADPAGAPGRTLALSRVTIPARTALALHHHPGTQIAYIQRGTLTYTVKTGVVNVYRGAADQSRTVASILPLARVFPSGAKATQPTPSVCPRRAASSRFAARFHSRTA